MLRVNQCHVLPTVKVHGGSDVPGKEPEDHQLDGQGHSSRLDETT